jgi:hypothetical protein
MGEENFEEGKTVEEYVDELNQLVIEPERFPEGQPMENVAEIIEKQQKKKEPEKKPEVSKSTTQTIVSTPKIIEPVVPVETPHLEVPVVEAPKVAVAEPKRTLNFSIDNLLEKAINKRFEVIDQKAARDKEQIVETVSDTFLRFIEAATSDVPVAPAPKLVPVPLPPEPPVIKEKIVVDNSATIQRIDRMLLDPSTKDKKALYQWKMELQGKTVKADPVEEDPESYEDDPEIFGKPKKKKINGEKKPTPYKLYIATFALVAVSSFFAYLSLSMFHIGGL